MSVIFKKRVITIISLVVVVAVAVTASIIAWKYIQSGKKNGSGISKMSTRQIVDSIIEQMSYRDITLIDESQLLRHYDVDTDMIDEFTMYVSSNIESAFEIACFKLDTAESVGAMTTSITEHMNNKAAGYMELNPVQYNMIMSYQTAVIENYVFVVVSNDAEAAKQIFTDMCNSK